MRVAAGDTGSAIRLVAQRHIHSEPEPFPSNSVDRASDWGWVPRLEAIMDTVLFTDQGILVFVITGSIAVVLSVLGLATTHQTRADIEHQLKG